MKLLFDQNLAHRLVIALESLYPDSGSQLECKRYQRSGTHS